MINYRLMFINESHIVNEPLNDNESDNDNVMTETTRYGTDNGHNVNQLTITLNRFTMRSWYIYNSMSYWGEFPTSASARSKKLTLFLVCSFAFLMFKMFSFSFQSLEIFISFAQKLVNLQHVLLLLSHSWWYSLHQPHLLLPHCSLSLKYMHWPE